MKGPANGRSGMRTTWDKGQGCLVPADADTEDWLAKQPADALIRGEFKALRNPAHHRKFFALVNLVFENLPEGSFSQHIKSPELLVSALKIGAGHYDFIWAKSEQNIAYQCRIPRSISFAKMDQHEFEQFYDRCCDVIIRDFWPDMDKATLKAEVAEMCGAGGFSEIGRMAE